MKGKWIKGNLHTFYTREKNSVKEEKRLWIFIDEDGHTVYQVYLKLNDSMDK